MRPSECRASDTQVIVKAYGHLVIYSHRRYMDEILPIWGEPLIENQ